MKINSVGDDFSYIVFTDGTQYTAADSEKCSSIHREAHVMVKCPTKGKLEPDARWWDFERLPSRERLPWTTSAKPILRKFSGIVPTRSLKFHGLFCRGLFSISRILMSPFRSFRWRFRCRQRRYRPLL